MLIVVTGASGRLGKHVVRDLLEHGHDIRPIDLHPSGDANLPLTCLADLRNAADLAPLMKGADAVCHLGNVPRISDFPLTDKFANNVAATHAVFETALNAGVRRMVNASSIQAYGVVTSRADHRPTPPVYLPIDEDHPLLPRDAYPLSKAMGEWIADSFTRRCPELIAFSLRFTCITERFSAASAPDSIGGSLLTAIHPRDAAIAVRLCCTADSRGHVPLNILSPRAAVPWEMHRLNDFYGTELPFRAPLNATDALFTTRRAEQLLGFTARPVPLESAAA